MLWLCVLLSECPDSLAGTVPVLTALVTGVEVAKAGQVLLWLKCAGLDVRESVFEATLRGRPLGRTTAVGGLCPDLFSVMTSEELDIVAFGMSDVEYAACGDTTQAGPPPHSLT